MHLNMLSLCVYSNLYGWNYNYWDDQVLFVQAITLLIITVNNVDEFWNIIKLQMQLQRNNFC